MEALLESGQGDRAMAVLSRIRIPMIDAGEHEGVVQLLNELADAAAGTSRAARMAGGHLRPHQRFVPLARCAGATGRCTGRQRKD